MFSLESFYKHYETETTQLTINGRHFQILLPKDLAGFIDPKDVLHEFPLWAKIWRASWVLADFLAAMPAEAGKSMLEIGGGAGLVSIVAASFGHRVTLTELNPDALQFARANAVLNGCPTLSIRTLDWNQPQLAETFDYIVASEVTYKEEHVGTLLKLFNTYLKPAGSVYLTGEMRLVSRDFFQQLETAFDLRVQKKVLRSADDETTVFLFRMTRKKQA
jgi:predicted nicotinamide N-methyase